MGVQERLSLEAIGGGTVIASEHVHRYELAARLCTGLRVVDLACGSGYGSAILREHAASVLGVDNDAETIATATRTVAADHDVTFEAADALAFVSRDLSASYDAIVCFEGLEHFPQPDAVLGELARHASAGMRLVVSVPNSKGFEEENDFHVTDFGYEEARAAFERLGEVRFLYQFLAEGSLIRAEEPAELAGDFVLPQHGDVEWANHFIACVNLDAEVRGLGQSAQMRLPIAPLYNRYMRDLERANRELWHENTQLARERIGMGGSAAAAAVARERELEEQVRDLEQRVRESERLLAKPRHVWVERARSGTRKLPLADRLTRFIGLRLSRRRG